MSRHAAVAAILALLCLADVVRADAVLDDVFAADRAFARQSADAGAQSAFLQYLAPDAVLFRPLAVNGVQWLRTHEEATGRLDWSPAGGRAACDGGLAVTLGPWSYTQDTTVDTGYYLTLWRLDAAGRWQVALDHGIDAPVPGHGAVPAGITPVIGGAAAACEGGGSLESLTAADGKLNDLASEKGLDVALRRSLAAGGLVLRDGHAPAQPTGDWPADASRWKGAPTCVTRGVVASPGSDLGYSYGELTLRAKRKAPAVRAAVFVRVWAREGRDWRVLIDMTTALPEPGAAP